MTYLLLNLAILAAVAILAVRAGVRPTRQLLTSIAVLVALTAIFDPIIIALDIVAYQPDAIMGIYWFGAPIEDFAYAIAAPILVSALWRIVPLGEEK